MNSSYESYRYNKTIVLHSNHCLQISTLRWITLIILKTSLSTLIFFRKKNFIFPITVQNLIISAIIDSATSFAWYTLLIVVIISEDIFYTLFYVARYQCRGWLWGEVYRICANHSQLPGGPSLPPGSAGVPTRPQHAPSSLLSGARHSTLLKVTVALLPYPTWVSRLSSSFLRH